jgi:hypothetical protein
MIACGSPGILPGTDDAVWFTEGRFVVMRRQDGREIAVSLQDGACAACVAQALFLQSTEIPRRRRKRKR